MKTTLRLLLSGLALIVLGVWTASAGAQMTPGAPGGARAQDGGTVSYDAPVEGAITNEAFTQTWAFQPVSADRITIRVERLDGNLIPDVSLLDSNGTSVAASYGADYSRAVAEIANYRLPSGSNYQIQVTRESAESGTTAGRYRLTITPLALAPDNPNNTVVAGPIELDSSVTGEITPVHWRDLHSLTLDAGDEIQVRMERLQGTLYPEVQLLDANGNTLTTGWTERAGDFAEIASYVAPSGGAYTLLATRYSGQDGETLGSFQLTVTLLGSGEQSSRLQVPPGTIGQYNTPVQGQITNANWYQDWQFLTVAGDTITIIARRSPQDAPETPNNLQPMIILLGGAGQELTRGWLSSDGWQAVIERYTITPPGTYTVRVTRDGEKGGPSSGSYELAIMLEGVGQGSPSLEPVTGALQLGTPAAGEITAVRWADTWTYDAQAGQSITITVTRAGGTLVPLVELQDANGQPITSAYYGDSEDSAVLEYTFSTAGTYRVVVYRDGQQNGYTTGTYSLLVAQAAQ